MSIIFEKYKAKKNEQKIAQLRKELDAAEALKNKLTTSPSVAEQPVLPIVIPPPLEETQKFIKTKKNVPPKKNTKTIITQRPIPDTPNPVPFIHELEPPLPERCEKYDPITHQKWTVKLKDKLWPERAILINMELDSGFHVSFVLHSLDKEFNYSKRTYYIDETLKYYSMTAKLYCLDYHQSFSMPIKRVIDHTKIRQAIQASGMCEVEAAVNPSNLEAFIKSKVIEQLMKAQEITEFFKTIKFMIIIMLILHIINFLMGLKNSGALDKVSGMI